MNAPAVKPWPKDQRYLVTSDGKVIGPKGRALKPRVHMHGYVRMSVVADGVTRDFYVHRVVCETFHGPAADPTMQVDHINGERGDNRAENLRWVTKATNLEHRKHPVGVARRNTILSDEQVRGIRAAVGSQSVIARRFGISREHVRDIRNGKERRHVA